MAGGRRVEMSFVVIVVVAFLVLAAMSYGLKQNRDLARQGREAHDALCVFKNDLAVRVKNSAEFIRLHPNGIPGIPASTIRNSVATQTATLASLSLLDCVPPPDPKETP